MVERQLPVPLRVFIRNLRDMSRSITGLGLLSLVLVLPALIGLVMRTGALGVLAGAGVVALWLAAAGAAAAWQARKVVRAGFTLEETRLALLEDVNRRNEEIRFDVGPRTTPFDTLLSWTTGGALSVSLLALLAIGVAGLDGSRAWQFFGVGLFGAMGAGLVRAARRARRADLVGERWLRIWGGKAGDWLFKLASLGLDPPTSLPAGVHRSTEVALGLAAVRLFDELPRETRRELEDLPATVRRLEGDARVLRAQVKELDAVLDELGEDPRTAGAGARDTVRREVGATRDEAARRLRDVVAALETIRVGLLRMHAGESIVHSVTMELDAARAISGDMEDLLEGHREVERLLAERRATGAFEIAELPDTFPAEG
jgi:hypothetical protein